MGRSTGPPPRPAPDGGQRSLMAAMTMLASTQTTMTACIQIQKGDTPQS
jgi:hypothetical protein